MGRKKKVDQGVLPDRGFEDKINKLKQELEIANICNQLIQSENPFSIEIKNKEFFQQIRKELKVILQSKISNNNQLENSNSSDYFTTQEVKILKQFAKQAISRIDKKQNNQGNTKNFIIDFSEGDYITLKKQSVFRANNNSFLLPQGMKLMVVKNIDNKKIKAIHPDNGIEGILNINDIQKEN